MQDWSGRRVIIIGAARQGTALAKYLAQHQAQVVVTDRRNADQLESTINALQGLPLEWQLGDHPLDILEDAEVIFPSGGVPLENPLVQEALRRGIPLSNDSQVFLEAAPCRVIGITGSAGKTTTTSLVGRIAQVAFSGPDQLPKGRRVWVGGNIGNPLISDIADMQTDDLVIMELSSFQLEWMTRSPQVAAVLNITPNHLDRHGTMQAYTAAKARILQFQSSLDVAVLGRDDPGAWALASSVHGSLYSFGLKRPDPALSGTYIHDDWLYLQHNGEQTPILETRDIKLRGEHNLYNVLAACSIITVASLPPKAMLDGVKGFSGVPHRLEFVRSWGGAQWYNDSIATAPERAMAAIRSFCDPLVLLAGGRDKNLPWEEFASLIQNRVDHLVLFGEAAPLIASKLDPEASRPFTIDSCQNLHEAILAAARVVQPGDIVLLSPGGTSFDEFTDFEERGRGFRKWVNELK